MLLPALNKAREKARQSQCLSNLKQCGQIFNFYHQDYPGHMAIISRANTTYKFWSEIHADYIVNRNILDCPSFKPHKYVARNFTYGIIGATANDSGNGVSNPYVGTNGTTTLLPGKVKQPSRFMHLTESSNEWVTNPSYPECVGWCQVYTCNLTTLPSTSAFPAHFRHSNQADALYLDGHCKAVGIPQFVEDARTRVVRSSTVNIYVRRADYIVESYPSIP